MYACVLHMISSWKGHQQSKRNAEERVKACNWETMTNNDDGNLSWATIVTGNSTTHQQELASLMNKSKQKRHHIGPAQFMNVLMCLGPSCSHRCVRAQWESNQLEVFLLRAQWGTSRFRSHPVMRIACAVAWRHPAYQSWYRLMVPWWLHHATANHSVATHRRAHGISMLAVDNLKKPQMGCLFHSRSCDLFASCLENTSTHRSQLLK